MTEKSKFKLSKNSVKRLEGVNPDLIKLVYRVLSLSPHDFGIPQYGGKRSTEDQAFLFEQINPRVTWVDGIIKISYHQKGEAVDIFIFDEHGACWVCLEKYKEVADIFKSEFEKMKGEGYFKEYSKIRWGGDFKPASKIDRPHFEIRK